MVFAAGLLSFLSPCVLPLIPSYLSLLGGIGIGGGRGRNRLVPATAFFVLGFTAVFMAMSIAVSRIMFFGGRVIQIAAGIIVILMGLQALFNIFGFLNYEKRFHLNEARRSYAGCFVAGMAFGAGWTPCVGPILTGVLVLASRDGSLAKAAAWLAVYSAGLGLPFMLASVFLRFFTAKLSSFSRAFGLIQKTGGVLLVVLGFLILSGSFNWLNGFFQRRGFGGVYL
jgi:cytochrome c-type biogenesis protein